MKKKLGKKAISILLAVLIGTTGLVPAFSVFAEDSSVDRTGEIQLFYKESDRMIPDKDIDEQGAEIDHIEYMIEGDELELTYKLINTVMPDNGTINWYSETPTLVDVTQEGVVKAFDSSKGAVVQSWIDNEVKTVPIIGKLMGVVIEKALFNDKVNVDTMDTDAIVAVIEGMFEADGALANVGGQYKDQLINSLRKYLDNINSNIHVELKDANGELIADDFVKICVKRCDEWYANFLPNGTHITNKSQIDTTVAVGSTCQLYAITTPVRLEYGCVYSVKSTSIFDQGKVVATVDDSGLVRFKNTGTVTIIVSPDSEQVIENILKLVNYFYEINTDTIDTKQLADILIKYVGIDMNRNVLAALLDACFIVADIAGDAADPVKLSATAVKIIANLVLQFKYNDKITFNVIDAQPLEDFNINDSVTSVKEGEQLPLDIVDIKPSTGDTSDIVWSSADPNIASVDPETGVVIGRDAGNAYGNLSSQTCEITASSEKYNIQKTIIITVTGKTGNNLSDVEIIGETELQIGDEVTYDFNAYPARIDKSKLNVTWGILIGEDETGLPEYAWATADTPATDERGVIDTNGNYRVVSGGITTVAVEVKTGYSIGSTFISTSSRIATLEVTNGIPVERITINATKGTSNGKLDKDITVNINGEDHRFITIHKGIGEGYAGNGAWFEATVEPENATFTDVTWVVDNGYYEIHKKGDDTHTITVEQKAGHEVADAFRVYAVSHDGKVVSNEITVCITKNYVTDNVINEAAISVINGKTADSTHTVSFEGSLTNTASACYKCNWYSSDESIFKVETKRNDNRDATITGVDVGTATLYCVSVDGAIVNSRQVTVLPDKTYLKEIIDLCENTPVRKTSANSTLYKQYMNRLDLAYSVYYDKTMASQTTCDTYADKLLYAFYKVGGFIGIKSLDLIDENGEIANNKYYTVSPKTLESYKNYSYDFDLKINPRNAMYSRIEWTSSNKNISVDEHGKCTPTSNDPCAAIITCTVYDYMGGKETASAYLAFAKEKATGIELDKTSIEAGKIYTSDKITAKVLPLNTLGNSKADCKDVIWTSSNESVATVSSNGEVSFLTQGEAVITATTLDGGFTASCTVNVVPNYDELIKIIGQCEDEQLDELNFHPVTWVAYKTALDAAKAMVDANESTQQEIDDMCVELKNAHDGLEKYNYIQGIEIYLDGEKTSEFYQYDLGLLTEGLSYKNAKLELKIRLNPNNGSYKTVTWESDTDLIAVESGVCTLTANKSGYGLITCTVEDHYGNSFTDTVWVSFSYRPVTSMEMSDTEITGEIGETKRLTCTPKSNNLLLSPEIKEFYWVSENPDIATVDSLGNVTFVSTGATVVKAISYDGGITGECRVSTNGDRIALREAIETSKNVDYTDYKYEYGMAFKTAYENAQIALTDTTYTQSQIDEATSALVSAYNALEGNEYQKVENIVISYQTYKNSTKVANGTIGANDALSVDISSGYALSNYFNKTEFTASVSPETTYKSLSWSSSNTSNVDISESDGVLTFKPSHISNGAKALVTVTVVDDYDRETTRTVSIVMSDKVCKSFDITPTEMSLVATESDVEIPYTITDCDFKDIIWTSSDEGVVRVENGKLYPVDGGVATVTGKTVDGGLTDSVKITVTADFSVLRAKHTEYKTLVDNSTGKYIYTDESLERLNLVVGEAGALLDTNASQAEIDALVTRLDEAYNGLQEYIAVTSVALTAQSDSSVTVNGKSIRYKNTALSNKTIQLVPVFNDENAKYANIEYTTSNNTITVSEAGLVTNTNSITSNWGVCYGDITVTVTNVFGETSTDTVTVSFVRNEVTAVSFDKELVYGAPNETVTVTPTITGDIKDCTFTSSNPEIATVDNTGLITFVAPGEAVITAKTVDGGLTATITAYTTCDTSALKGAIDEAQALNYQDYEYAYGIALRDALNSANGVYADYRSTQDAIDEACSSLITALSEAKEHPFIAPTFTFMSGDKVLKNGGIVEADDAKQAVISVSVNSDAMVNTPTVTVNNASNCITSVNGMNVTVTKGDADGTVTVTVTATDDYARQYSESVNLSVKDKIILATGISLTVDGSAVGDTYSATTGKTFTGYGGFTLGYVTTPANANSVVSVEYTSDNEADIKVDANGKVTLAKKVHSLSTKSYTATIIVRVTNSDESVIEKSVVVTIAKS